jgi:hypothetical protein
MLVFALAIATALRGAAGAQPVAAQPGDAQTAAIVERAGRYVQAYMETFSAVVSEERQVQKLIRPDGRVRQTRDLRSDFLLVKTGSEWPQVFRDVIDVDGKPVRNREDRLRKLFLQAPKTALEQARAIARESGRHNIGVQRTGNSPMLPLLFLTPRKSSGSRWAFSGTSLTFEEFRSPSVLAGRRGSTRMDLMARGSFTIEPDSGRVLAGEFTTTGPAPAPTVSLAVRYEEDPVLKLMVPVEVKERYQRPDKPKNDHLEASATYANFRRFQVTVDEKIKAP